MGRTFLTDGVTWFDESKATCYKEEVYFDGRNRVSVNTRDQWHHQELFLTAKGKWILHQWSQWQGSTDSYEEITPDQAAIWLARNKYEIPENLQHHVDKLEV